MIVAVTQGELADLAPQLPPGKLRTWCERSSRGSRKSIVYVQQSTLSDCRAAANSPVQVESITTIEESQSSEEFQGQSGANLAPEFDAGEDSADAGEAGVGPAES